MAERQLATTLSGIRHDHLARYLWVSELLGDKGHVIDAACGCGYGSSVLADRGFDVTAIDIAKDALAYAKTHWDRPTIAWLVGNLEEPSLPDADAVVSFETVEHLIDPKPFLTAARKAAPRLVVSVPNQDVIPFDKKRFPFHHRHYTLNEVKELLAQCGWLVTAWFGQRDKYSVVWPELDGRTLVVDAVRVE